MRSLVQDLRYSARKLARTPGFTAIAVLTIALGVGATTAITSVVNSVLVEPLPFDDPSRLLFVEATSPQGKPMSASPQDYLDFRAQTHSFTDMAAVIGGESQTLTRPGAVATRLNEARVSATFFSVLGVQPELGRFFARDEDSKEAPRVVVLSHLGWMKYFGGDERVVGRRITLDGNVYQVVGVAPPSIAYPSSVDAWVPAVWHDYEIGDGARGFHEATIVARLAPGATSAGALAELNTITARLSNQFPTTNAKIGAYVEGLQHHIVGDVGNALWALLGAVALVLLIACANVANLLLVRASSRESELAVRTALGAGRGRLVRQLITESLLLSVVGSAVGVLFAAWALSAVVAFGPRGLPRLNEISIDGQVLAFTAGLAIVVGVAFGLVPALHAARSDVSSMLRAGARGAGGRANRTRTTLVLAEVALAMVLLVGAGLLLRSFQRLTHKNPGFDPAHLVVFDVSLAGKSYGTDDGMNRFANDVSTRVAALPGTESVAVAADRPFDPDPPFGASTSFTVDGEAKPTPGTEPVAQLLPVSPNYFATMGLPLLRGRAFNADENRRDGPQAVVINEALAKKYFPGQDPIGKHLTFGISHNFTPNPADSVRSRGEIVGIARDAAFESLAQPQVPVAYFAYGTLPVGATFLVRTTSDPSTVAGAILRAVHDIDPNVPVYELGTMDDALATSVAQPRFYSILLASFAGIALLLATLGIFGVISYVVSQRTREFGIRIALGATASDVARSVVRRGVLISTAGIVIGGLAAAAVTRAIRSMLFETDAVDLPTFVAVAVLLAGVAALASWLPARRAGRVDPTVAMRAE